MFNSFSKVYRNFKGIEYRRKFSIETKYIRVSHTQTPFEIGNDLYELTVNAGKPSLHHPV